MRRLASLLLCLSLLFAPAEANALKLKTLVRAAVTVKTFQTYTKIHKKTGKIYVGRTSGKKSAAENIKRRDMSHHRNKDGFGKAKLDRKSPNKNAIRGREQQIIDKNRKDGVAAEQINGISPSNPKRQSYLDAAKKEFGKP